MPTVEQRAVSRFGKEKQTVIAIEEMSELQKELTKYLRGMGDISHISEEMADVQIVLDELEIIFGNRLMVKDWKKFKEEKLEKLIELHGGRCDE